MKDNTMAELQKRERKIIVPRPAVRKNYKTTKQKAMDLLIDVGLILEINGITDDKANNFYYFRKGELLLISSCKGEDIEYSVLFVSYDENHKKSLSQIKRENKNQLLLKMTVQRRTVTTQHLTGGAWQIILHQHAEDCRRQINGEEENEQD